MKAIFIVKKGDEIPPMEELVYEDNGVTTGGYTLVEQKKNGDRIYWIESSANVLEGMKTKHTFDKYVDDGV